MDFPTAPPAVDPARELIKQMRAFVEQYDLSNLMAIVHRLVCDVQAESGSVADTATADILGGIVALRFSLDLKEQQ